MIKIITAPAAYPVLAAEAREWCRIDTGDTSQDATITLLIRAMTDYAEHLTGRAYVQRTLELDLDCFDYCIVLPQPPLIGIDSIAYTDINEAVQTVSSATYEADTVSQPGHVRPLSGQSWPAIGSRFNPVRIQYRAGYAYVGSPTDYTDMSYLPANLRLWMQARIATLYENREQIIAQNRVEIPRNFADGLLDSLVIGSRLF